MTTGPRSSCNLPLLRHKPRLPIGARESGSGGTTGDALLIAHAYCRDKSYLGQDCKLFVHRSAWKKDQRALGTRVPGWIAGEFPLNATGLATDLDQSLAMTMAAMLKDASNTKAVEASIFY